MKDAFDLHSLTEGFVTLATGDDRYFQLAHNLLVSYRKHSVRPKFFAIIADRENTYTADFDHTVLLPRAVHSYMDKLSVLDNLPFDRNIFIDADCLIYRNIDALFNTVPWRGVTMYGNQHPLHLHGNSWFYKEHLCEYSSRVSYGLETHGGIMFICKDNTTKHIYHDCLQIAEHYADFHFRMFTLPADEPIIALAMAANGCTTLPFAEHKDVFVFIPLCKKLHMNMVHDDLQYTEDGKHWIKNVHILHWQNTYTQKPRYQREIERMMQGESIRTEWNFLVNTIHYFCSRWYHQTYRFAKSQAKSLLYRLKLREP